MARLIMAAGGARSGKSRWAEERVAARDRVVYIATMAAGDGELAERIRRHRARRPDTWTTIEAPDDLAGAFAAVPAGAEAVLVDCLTLFLSNRLTALQPVTADTADAEVIDRILEEIDAALAAAAAVPAAEVVFVTNEVGAGVVPPSPLGRAFRDLQGWTNQRLAAAAAEVYLLQFGLPTRLK
jgi:adenosylcobinamide kinase/adenosylcobinamide-phosphate guanylyltransferase